MKTYPQITILWYEGCGQAEGRVPNAEMRTIIACVVHFTGAPGKTVTFKGCAIFNPIDVFNPVRGKREALRHAMEPCYSREIIEQVWKVAVNQWRLRGELPTKQPSLKALSSYLKETYVTPALTEAEPARRIFALTDNGLYELDFVESEGLSRLIQRKEPKIMTFSEALDALKSGAFAIQRQGWNGPGLLVKLQRPDEHSKMTLPYLYIEYPPWARTTPGARCPWLASQTDILAEDWQVVREEAAAGEERAIL